MIRTSLIFKTIAFIILISFTSTSLQAQKTSNTQKNSLWIEEDANTVDNGAVWTTQFQAYNRATMVNYTIANNKKNLYFFIQSVNSAITNKIMHGGITISVNKKGEKKTNGCPSITYPIVRPADMRYIYDAEYKTNSANQTGLTGNEFVSRQDSIMSSINKKLISVIREIKVLNLKGVTDTLISVYNEYGIKASVMLSNKSILTYTLILPLKAFGINDNINELAYNIMLNGPSERPRQVPVEVQGDVPEGGGTINVFRGVGQVKNNEITPKMAEMISTSFTTDFWGKYTLLKNKN